MLKRTVSGIMLILLLIGMLMLAFNVQPVKATGTIYIRADGSIYPPTANITSSDNATYYLTDNNYDSIIVERDNIVIDGACYTLEGTGAWDSIGISLYGRSNVTIKDIEIKAFGFGIYLSGSSNNSITGNKIKANHYRGIWLEYSLNNSIFKNNITANDYDGINLYESSNNSITGNDIKNNRDLGVYLDWFSHSNIISGNNITDNRIGIVILLSFYNIVSGNNITNSSLAGVYLGGSFNIVSGNNITNNYYHGVWMIEESYSNTVSGNNITENNESGILLDKSSDNVISGNNIINNWVGISLRNSSDNSIFGNILADNAVGIEVYCSSNSVISRNNITWNSYYGIHLLYSSSNSISWNNIRENYLFGIRLGNSSGNIISANNVINNWEEGVSLRDSSNNKFYHNNFVNNAPNVHIDTFGYANSWDDGYPSGGNYWSDYTGVNLYSGPYQNETGSDGIGDTPYVIDANNTDRYPLTHPWSSLPVHNINTGSGYATIQEAINAASNGDTIFVYSGIYIENVVVNKSLSLIGENTNTTIIDGNVDYYGIFAPKAIMVKANDVIITKFTIRNEGFYGDGVVITESLNTSLFSNVIIRTYWDGVRLEYSSYCHLFNNTITKCGGSGIRIFSSCDNKVSGNIITEYGGVSISSSSNNTLSENNLVNTWGGFYFYEASNNRISENNIVNSSGIGVVIDRSFDNRFYHNNFINNTNQVYVYELGYANTWDAGYPSGGNYWSDYVGVDVKNGLNQDLLGSDCIGDTPYTIDENNQDHYPLMKPWTLMPTTYTFPNVWGEETFIVSVESNSTVSNFAFNQPDKEISFNVTGEAGTIGFCNVTIPKALLYGEPWTVLIDGAPVPATITENETHCCLYFTYPHSTHSIQIIGTWVIAPPTPLSVSISPLSASTLMGQSVTFTSNVSGGVTPYSYQWYLNGNPVSGATSASWTFTPSISGIYYVYLKVTDDVGNTTQSETARIIAATVPVGGYSFPIEGYAAEEPLTFYLALVAILTLSFSVIKRKKHRRTNRA